MGGAASCVWCVLRELLKLISPLEPKSQEPSDCTRSSMDAAWARVLDVLPDTPEEQIELGFRIVRHAHQQRLRQSEVNASKILERQKSEQDRRTKQMMEERQVVVNERTKLLEENRRCARGGGEHAWWPGAKCRPLHGAGSGVLLLMCRCVCVLCVGVVPCEVAGFSCSANRS